MWTCSRGFSWKDTLAPKNYSNRSTHRVQLYIDSSLGGESNKSVNNRVIEPHISCHKKKPPVSRQTTTDMAAPSSFYQKGEGEKKHTAHSDDDASFSYSCFSLWASSLRHHKRDRASSHWTLCVHNSYNKCLGSLRMTGLDSSTTLNKSPVGSCRPSKVLTILYDPYTLSLLRSTIVTLLVV